MDGSAKAAPSVIRMSTASVEPRHRAQLIGDIMAQEIVGGTIRPIDDTPIVCHWSLAFVGPGAITTTVMQSGMFGQRTADQLRDGDDGVSIFIGRRGIARFDQNDRRERLLFGEAMIVAHARPIAIEWPHSDLNVLRLPRSVLPAITTVEAAGGRRLAAATPVVRLFTAYLDAVTPAAAGTLPDVAARHLAELSALLVTTAAGRDAGTQCSGPAVQAARLAAIREHIALRFADPGLTMARVAAAIGLSERSGYLVCESAGVGFSEMVLEVRLSRAREALASGFQGRLIDLAFAVGFTDLSHFNRRFRARFGMSPGETRHRPQ